MIADGKYCCKICCKPVDSQLAIFGYGDSEVDMCCPDCYKRLEEGGYLKSPSVMKDAVFAPWQMKFVWNDGKISVAKR